MKNCKHNNKYSCNIHSIYSCVGSLPDKCNSSKLKNEDDVLKDYEEKFDKIIERLNNLLISVQSTFDNFGKKTVTLDDDSKVCTTCNTYPYLIIENEKFRIKCTSCDKRTKEYSIIDMTLQAWEQINV